MQVALVHEVGPNLPAHISFKEYVVRHHYTGTASRFETTIDVLKKAELFVARGKGKVRAARQTAAFFCPEGRIGKDKGCLRQCLTFRRERIAIMYP